MSPLAHPFEPAIVLAFWREAGPARWFRKDDAFDRVFATRFIAAHEAAARGELSHWAADGEGALALLILLDQFPRNVFRGSARMYATDAQARAVARSAVDAGFDRQCAPELRNFFYLPFMHSESAADHDLCVQLAGGLGGEAERFARHHREIIQRFGRFPHRNAVLGRESTPAELVFLADGGFRG